MDEATKTVMEKIAEFNSDVIYLYDTKTGENCAICDFELTKKFPETFPNEWKMCCDCIMLAKRIITSGKLVTKLLYGDYILGSYVKERINKIYKTITLKER